MSEITRDPWARLRGLTPARIALGRTGASLPTPAVLHFALNHAQARDAVHLPLDRERVANEIAALGHNVIHVRSAAPDRATYLRRPDLGRTLLPEDAARLRSQAGQGADIALIVADGLSSAAIHAHAAPLIEAFQQRLPPGTFRLAPIVIATQARVALGDEIGAALKARISVMLIGERPGLSSPDSLGLYLTFDPRPGRSDAERNCISNIRASGLSYATAAHRLLWHITEAFRLGKTGIALKDMSDVPHLESED